MISPLLYSQIYLYLVAILTLIQMNKYAKYRTINISRPSEDIMPSFILTAIIALFIGFRPISYIFVDMVNYNEYYYHAFSANFSFDWNAENFLFDNLFYFLSSNSIDIRFFFVIMAVIYFTGILIACRKFFPNDTFYALLVYLGAFSTFSYGTNGIKAGAAASVFLVALAYNHKKVVSILIAILSIGMQHSMTLPVYAYICVLIFNKPKYYLWGWLASIMIAFLHISFFQELFAGLSDSRGSDYLTSTDDWGGKGGFRLDFIIYSSIAVFAGYYAIFIKKVNSKSYRIIYCTYLFTNAVWMLCMYASFTNRIAYLSWFMLPIVTIYPFLTCKIDKSQYLTMNKFVGIYLAFTIFSEYYL